ncbi:MAG: acyl-CoA thioesterase [Isosphaeraceae bacterium]
MSAQASAESLLAQFKIVISIPVQWGDQDAFGHVNNTIYLRWFESARIVYLERVGMMELHEAENVGPILAAVACDYRRPVTYPDTVLVGARVTRIGRSSFGMEHAAASRGHGVIAAEGKSTLVVFDYHKEKSHPIPQALRQAIEALEGRSFH